MVNLQRLENAVLWQTFRQAVSLHLALAIEFLQLFYEPSVALQPVSVVAVERADLRLVTVEDCQM